MRERHFILNSRTMGTGKMVLEYTSLSARMREYNTYPLPQKATKEAPEQKAQLHVSRPSSILIYRPACTLCFILRYDLCID